MKKVLAGLAVAALVGLGSMAYAADVTVGGSLEIRSRNFSNLLLDKDLTDATNGPNNKQVDTQSRIKIDINAKAGDNVKGKLELMNDFDTWGKGTTLPNTGTGLESTRVGSVQGLGFHEAWINFNVPGVPVNVTAGHQLLQLGQGYFFTSKHFGSDAWVVANQTGNNTAALVDVKAIEGATYNGGDDVDAYVLLDVLKLDDKNTVGIDITNINDRNAALDAAGTAFARAGFGGAFKSINLYNIGLNYTGVLGPVNLKAELDWQMGTAKAVTGGTDSKFKGNQIVITGNVPMDANSLNFTLARGTGNKTNSNDTDQFITVLDIDPHVAFLYEYKLPTAALNAASQAASNDRLNTGFANTTAVNVGYTFAAAKSLSLGANLWYFKATEKITNAANESTDDIGNEIDVNVKWQLYDNLSWNWDLGYFMPGKVYNKANGDKGDAATGIQGVLALKF